MALEIPVTDILPQALAWNTQPSGFMRYLMSLGLIVWPMNDTVGSSVLSALPSASYNGVNHGITMGIPSGTPMGYAGEFDGLLDYGQIYTAALAAAFNPDVWTMLVGIKMPAGGWDEIANRYFIVIGTDTNNLYYIRHTAIAGRASFSTTRGGTAALTNVSGIANYEWVIFGMTINSATYGMRPYINGVQQGADRALVGVWAGALMATYTALGSFSGTSASSPHKGQIAFAACGPVDLTALMLTIAQRGGTA